MRRLPQTSSPFAIRFAPAAESMLRLLSPEAHKRVLRHCGQLADLVALAPPSYRLVGTPQLYATIDGFRIGYEVLDGDRVLAVTAIEAGRGL